MEKLKFDESSNKSEYKKVRINIDSGYYWGPGFKSHEDARAFHAQVIPALKKAGVNVVEPSMIGASNAIEGPGKTYLYLHPMEFTGYMKKEDVGKVVEVLKTCPAIKKVDEPILKEVYELNDWQYKRVLIDNLKEINRWFEENPKQDAFKFASKFRIPRVGDKGILGSDDVDIAFIEDYLAIKKALGY